tara:strand:+ start:267 stop:500 length:234 start_codon:yes stop_codon:yes gene_type:complete
MTANDQRIEALERSNRRHRWCLTALALVLVGMIGSGMQSVSTLPSTMTVKLSGPVEVKGTVQVENAKSYPRAFKTYQ